MDQTSQLPRYLENIAPFFKSTVDWSQIKKPLDVLDLPFSTLKIVDPEWNHFFEDMEIDTIKDLAQHQEKIVIEGLDPEETNKMAMIAEMIFWKMTQIAEHGDQKRKIVFFGLGNAGKTSAITALSEKYSTIKELLPTRGLERQTTNIFGFDLMTFDFGGQKQYREQYFEKADMYFSEADMMVYCIDIQDPNRFEESITYLHRILDTYKKYNLTPPVLVVFTKMDPDIANDEKVNANRIKLIDEIEKITADFDISYTNSSIFERNSIENVFSLTLKRISTSGGVIQELLRIFAHDIHARACTLISSTGLVFGSFGETQDEEEMLKNSAAYLQNLYLFHITTGMQHEDFYELHYHRNDLHFISEYVMNNESGEVFLWVLTNDMRLEVLGIQTFKHDIMPLINLFL